MREIGIIGGGASGLIAAIAAAKAGANVTVLEKNDRVGKKILATGNGKCNLSNRDFCAERDYRSHDPNRLPSFFETFGVEDTIAFFEENGLFLMDKGGYLYPRSQQASTVLDFMRNEAARRNVQILPSCQATEIRLQRSAALGLPGQKRFCVKTGNGQYLFDSLIVACGSRAGLNAKDAYDSWDLVRKLGIKVYEPLPALAALRCRGSFFKALAGVRCMAKVCLKTEGKDGVSKFEEEGELQLTDYGISGIPVFQCSRYAAEALHRRKKVTAELDFMPEIPRKDWDKVCQRQYRVCLGQSAGMLADGMIHKKVAQVLLTQCSLKAEEIVGENTKSRIFGLFEKMRGFEVEVSAVNPLENAQVCMGGVSLKEVDDNLQARKIPGLFFCGEMLDVDGRCGGYNLQWAWTSGYIAGSAAESRKE